MSAPEYAPPTLAELEREDDDDDHDLRGETCAYTVYDGDGEEQPCDRPATGWRWYQGHAHEDMLDVACELHENEGGRRIHTAESEAKSLAEHLGREILKVARVEALAGAADWRPLGTRVVVPLDELRAALAEADQ